MRQSWSSLQTIICADLQTEKEEQVAERPADDKPTKTVLVKQVAVSTLISPDICKATISSAFDVVYEKGVWGHRVQDITAFYNNARWPPKERKSASGHGSDFGYNTEISMAMINEAILKYNVTSMIDMPCGDVNWIMDSHLTDMMPLYLGLDIVKQVIEVNKKRFAHHSNKIFRLWDGTACSLPKHGQQHDDGAEDLSPFDLVHARDVIQHLPLDKGLAFVCNVLQSGARVFVTTTFPSAINRNIQTGDFYPNNLMLEPFGLPRGDSCKATHPTVEKDDTCVYDLTKPWVAEFVEAKCSEGNADSA